VEIGEQSADIIWIYDMREELGIFPHNVSSCSPVIVGNTLYTATSNGVDWSHTNIPAPNSPALVALNKDSGELIGEEASGLRARPSCELVITCLWTTQWPRFYRLGWW